jgi:hypothetical protein
VSGRQRKRRRYQGCQTLGDSHSNTIARQAGAGTGHHNLMQKMPFAGCQAAILPSKGKPAKYGESACLHRHIFSVKKASSPINTGASSYAIDSKQVHARHLFVALPFRRRDFANFPWCAER